MIPTSSWFRKSVAIFMYFLTAWLISFTVNQLLAPILTKGTIQFIVILIFVFVFNFTSPICSRYLSCNGTKDENIKSRIDRILSKLGISSYPINIYDHPLKSANSAGLFSNNSEIYITTSLVDSMSDEAILGVIAHENAHIAESHVLIFFLGACIFFSINLLLSNGIIFIICLLLFMTAKRYSEFRADANAAKVVGKETILKSLREIANFYPEKSWHRWLVFASTYPTLEMRINAIDTGKITYI